MIKKEVLVLIDSLKHFKIYLIVSVSPTTVYTDQTFAMSDAFVLLLLWCQRMFVITFVMFGVTLELWIAARYEESDSTPTLLDPSLYYGYNPRGLGEVSRISHRPSVDVSYFEQGPSQGFFGKTDYAPMPVCLCDMIRTPLGKDFYLLEVLRWGGVLWEGVMRGGVLWRCTLRRGILKGCMRLRCVWNGVSGTFEVEARLREVTCFCSFLVEKQKRILAFYPGPYPPYFDQPLFFFIAIFLF